MKKVLFASTALVAFGLAGVAQANEPIALKLGGYSTWVFGYADQDGINLPARAAVTAGGVTVLPARLATAQQFEDFHVKGTNEIFFLGSTTLANGLKVSVNIELEAGGQPEVTADPIDEAFITVDSAFGRVIIGSEDNAPYLIHVAAPVAAGTFYGEGEVGERRWIVSPGATTQLTTAINTDGDAQKISYFTPNFAGFTAGVTYVPSLNDAVNPTGSRPEQPTDQFLSDVIAIGAAYNNTFGGFGVKLSAGYLTVLDENTAATGIDRHREWSVGTQVGFAGFTVGGSYRNIDRQGVGIGDFGTDGRIWDAGVMWAQGPFGVSLTYQDARATGAPTTGDDRKRVYLATGRYALGPGVNLIAGGGHTDYRVDGADSNDGWWVASGIALSF